jgi:hypothetical protein
MLTWHVDLRSYSMRAHQVGKLPSKVITFAHTITLLKAETFVIPVTVKIMKRTVQTTGIQCRPYPSLLSEWR